MDQNFKNQSDIRGKYRAFALLSLFIVMLVGVAFFYSNFKSSSEEEGKAVTEASKLYHASDDLPLVRGEGLDLNDPELYNAGMKEASLIKRGENKQLIFPQAKKMLTVPGRKFKKSIFKLQDQELGPLSMNKFSQSAVEVALDRDLLKEFLASGASLLDIPLDRNRTASLKVDSIITRGENTHTLTGEVNKVPGSQVVLVFHDRVVSGSVAFYQTNEHYDFGNAGNGNMVVRLLKPKAFVSKCGQPGHHHDDVKLAAVAHDPADPQLVNAAPEESIQRVSADEAVQTYLDTVVGYGQEARIAEGGVAAIEAKIIVSVDRMNTAFENSQINGIRVELRGTIEDPTYVFPGKRSSSMGKADELGDLNNLSDGSLDVVSNLRIKLGADTNAFVIKDVNRSAGVADRPGKSMVIARTYMTSLSITYAHEFAHNIGSQHAWGDTGNEISTVKHNYGWRMQTASGDKVRTIMSYDYSWTRLPYFSNPDVQYNGVKTGAVDGYNASGDSTTDPRFVVNGYTRTAGFGYNGSHPSLGARNAQFISNQAHLIAAYADRPAVGLVVKNPDGEQMENGKSEVAFFSTAIGNPQQKTFTISNTGTSEITGLALSIDGSGASSFSLGSLSATTLSKGQTASFTVTYLSQVPISSGAVVHITKGGSLGNPFDFNISGRVEELVSSEGFEATPGIWSNSGGYDLNWTRGSGGTPTLSTGPSAASEGSYFMYINSSYPNNPNKTGALDLVYDLTSLLNAKVKFDYHMYGAEMGKLSVDVYDGMWHIGVWSITGQQHFSNNAAWTEAVIDLFPYQGKSGVKLRFRGLTALGSRGDMAIDNVRLFGHAENIHLTYGASSGGSLTGITSQTVKKGSSGTAIKAIPDAYYHFVNWSDGSTQNPRIDTGLRADLSVTANFTADAFVHWASVSGLRGNDALSTAVPFNDGVKNLLKFAFNMNGAGADLRVLTPGTGLSGLPVLTRDDTGSSPVLKYEYLRLKTGALRYTPVRSNTLEAGSWSTFSPSQTVQPISPLWERVVIILPDDGVPNSRWFYSIQVNEL